MSETGQRVPTVNLIGAGRVGQTLAHLWHANGCCRVQDVLTTSRASAQAACGFIGAGNAVEDLRAMRPADIWMLAVQDARIPAVAAALAQSHAPQSYPVEVGQAVKDAPVAFHCSGAQSSALLSALADRGWATASAHSILSFASPQTAAQQFHGTACALEGHPQALQALRPLFEAIGSQCFEVAAEQKLLYHAAAVFATNFLPALEQLAEDAWQDSGVPAALLPGLRATLMGHAAANVAQLGPYGALTGPAAREDVAALEQQSAVVRAWNAEAADAYDALVALTLRMAKAKREAAATTANTH